MRLQKLFLSSCLVLLCMVGMGNIVQAAEGDDVVSDPRGSRFHRNAQNSQLDDESSDETAMQDAPPLLDDGTGEENEQDAPPVLDDGTGEENEQDASLVLDESDQALDEAEQSDDEGMSDGEMAGLIAGSVAGAAVGAGAIALGVKKYQDGKNKGSQYEVVEDRNSSRDSALRSSQSLSEEESKKQKQQDERAKKLGGLSADEQVKFQKLVEDERAKGKVDFRKSGSQMVFVEKREVVRLALEPKDAKAVVVDEAEAKKQAQQVKDTEAKFRSVLRTNMRLAEDVSLTHERINTIKAGIPDYDKQKGSIAKSTQNALDAEAEKLKQQERALKQTRDMLTSFDDLIPAERSDVIQNEESERHAALADKLKNTDVKRDVEGYKRAVRVNINVQENIDLHEKRIDKWQVKKEKTKNPIAKIVLENKIKNEQKALQVKKDALLKAKNELQAKDENLKARNLSDVDRKLLQQEEIRKSEAKKKEAALKAAAKEKKKTSLKRLLPNIRGIRRAPPSSVGTRL